eukprot:m.18796 g.18796  ORF g.18796 m.18796 type:complete len:453 (+) comp6401_c1_seq1:306-1664(+)
MKLSSTAKALLSVGLDTSNDRLKQAAGRMRELQWGQRLVMCVPKHVMENIRKLFAAKKAIGVKEILDFTVMNTTSNGLKGLTQWCQQSLHFLFTKHKPEMFFLDEINSPKEMYDQKFTAVDAAEMFAKTLRVLVKCLVTRSPKLLSNASKLHSDAERIFVSDADVTREVYDDWSLKDIFTWEEAMDIRKNVQMIRTKCINFGPTKEDLERAHRQNNCTELEVERETSKEQQITKENERELQETEAITEEKLKLKQVLEDVSCIEKDPHVQELEHEIQKILSNDMKLNFGHIDMKMYCTSNWVNWDRYCTRIGYTTRLPLIRNLLLHEKEKLVILVTDNEAHSILDISKDYSTGFRGWMLQPLGFMVERLTPSVFGLFDLLNGNSNVAIPKQKLDSVMNWNEQDVIDGWVELLPKQNARRTAHRLLEVRALKHRFDFSDLEDACTRIEVQRRQ